MRMYFCAEDSHYCQILENFGMIKELPVTITEKALHEIMKIREKKNIPDKYGLRIGIKGAGCAGISYLLGFDTPTSEDGKFELNGLPVYISKKHTMHIMGLILDFHDDTEARGFMFSDDQAPK